MTFQHLGLLLWLAGLGCALQAQPELTYHVDDIAYSTAAERRGFTVVNGHGNTSNLLTSRGSNVYRSKAIGLEAVKTSRETYTFVALELRAPTEIHHRLQVNIQWGNGPTKHDDWTELQPLLYSGERARRGFWLSEPVECPAGYTWVRYSLAIKLDNTSDIYSLGAVKLHETQLTDLPAPQALRTTRRLPGAPLDSLAPPTFVSRLEWETYRSAIGCASPQFAPITHLVIGHSSTPNQSQNWLGHMLGLLSHQVNVLGRCDMTYNWFIDPEGRIYEGHEGGYGVVADFFCDEVNPDHTRAEVGTVGICLLGTYEDFSPPAAQLASLRQLIRWQLTQSQAAQRQAAQQGNSYVEIAPGLSAPLLGLDRDMPIVMRPSAVCSVERALWPGIVDAVTSIRVAAPSSIETDLLVYPNPSPGQFQVQLQATQSGSAQLSLQSLTGRVLWQRQVKLFPGEQVHPVSLPSLPDGLYYLHVATQAGKATRGVQIQH